MNKPASWTALGQGLQAGDDACGEGWCELKDLSGFRRQICPGADQLDIVCRSTIHLELQQAGVVNANASLVPGHAVGRI